MLARGDGGWVVQGRGVGPLAVRRVGWDGEWVGWLSSVVRGSMGGVCAREGCRLEQVRSLLRVLGKGGCLGMAE